MIAVIFEVFPADGKREQYLDLASALKSELNKIKGFISVERFQSLADPKKVLSLSFWEDEQSIAQWRNLEQHRNAQKAGRDFVFDDYRLRVANVIRDYGMDSRTEAPADSKAIHYKR